MKDEDREDLKRTLANGNFKDPQEMAVILIALELDRIARTLNDIYVSMPT